MQNKLIQTTQLYAWAMLLGVSSIVMAAEETNGMDHSAHGAMSMQGGAAADSARDPHAYNDGYDFGAIAPPVMMDQGYMAGLMVHRLEQTKVAGQLLTSYDLQARFGRDYNALVLKSEGELTGGKLHEARNELLWQHALEAYWDSQLGWRADTGMLSQRNWLAFGVQGLAPYWFNVEATAYLGEKGRSALRVSSEYDLLLTQKWVLQPRLESNVYGQSDAARNLGSGLSDVALGLRLRYEFHREFAPYIGIEWMSKFGGTADFAKLSGETVSQTRAVAGLKFWF